MMKTHVFSLMLSAAFFTTNPLFGMNEGDNPHEKKGIFHKFTDINEIHSKGYFSTIPNDITIEILLETITPVEIRKLPPSVKDIYMVSLTSKGMYTLIHYPDLLEQWAKKTKVPFSIESPLSIKKLFQKAQKDHAEEDSLYYSNLFTDPKKEYVVKTSEMLDFMKGGFQRCQDEGTHYNFSINGQAFTMFWNDRDYELQNLCPPSYMIFSYAPNLHGFYKTAFKSTSIISDDWSDKIQGPDEEHYKKCLLRHRRIQYDPFVIITAEERNSAGW